MEELKLGYEAGETCNRDGCKGTISEKYVDGSCSCHSNPPCSYCTTVREYCDECDWDLAEELYIKEQEYRKTEAYKKQQEQAQKEVEAREKYMRDFYDFYNSKEIATEFKCISSGHTHFSMRLMGYYPPSMSSEELMKEIRGTFGGRFERWDTTLGRFIYIAYTD